MDSVDDLSDKKLWASKSPDERLATFVQVCELARAILQEREDVSEVLDHNEPMPPQAEKTWRRLVAEARRARQAR